MKIIYYSIILASFGLLSSCNVDISTDSSKEEDIVAIKVVMDKQASAWNEGNIPGYMQGYWNNDSLVFIGSKGAKYGYKTTLENYKKSYPDKDAMGKLDFSSLQYKYLSHEYYYVTGAWRLIRKEDTPSGYFTLLFRKIDDKWVIVADHSS